MKIVYADVETAGALQSEVDRAGAGPEIEVRCVPRLWPGAIVADDGEAYSFELVRRCYAGPRVLLGGSAGPELNGTLPARGPFLIRRGARDPAGASIPFRPASSPLDDGTPSGKPSGASPG